MLFLFASLPSPALADEYQDAITKAFPGFQILGRSEIRLNRDNMDPEIYGRVKDRPALIVGRFNSDVHADFAALIRGTKLLHIPEDKANRVTAVDYYDGYLVVCLGLGAGQYSCGKLETSPMRILRPHDEYLMKVSPGHELCSILKRFKAPRPKRDPNVLEPQEGPVDISFNTDAIVLLGSGGVFYVPQPRGMYLECRVGG
jgi:hypothetical protein